MSSVAPEDERDTRAWLELARRGDFAAAWQVSDRILRRHVAAPDFTRPRHRQSVWRGEPLAGRRVLVRCYHGLGDTIQFIRFAPLLREIASDVTVWCQPPLIPLLRTARGIDRLLPLHDGSPGVDYDADVEVMELAYVFRTTLESIPADVPYLFVPPRDFGGTPPRVGVVWRAGDWETRRSMPFGAIRPLFDIEGVTWCSLQQNRKPSETHPRLLDISDPDLTVAAGRLRALDLLITVDSMPAHLAGALGIPVWTLLLKHADWRWMEGREDTPWYPTMTLIRQERDGDWEGVIERVSARLRQGAARSE